MATTTTAPSAIKKLTPKPRHVLPTNRIAFPKQLEVLRAYAAASGSGRAVTNDEVAKIAQLTASTVSLGNPFFSSIGLLKKQDPGYVASKEVLDFARQYGWDKTTASHKLAPLIVGTWFASAILPTLQIRAMDEQDALTSIADRASASTGHTANIRLLLQYLESSGVVAREGKQLVVGPMATAPPTTDVRTEESTEQNGGGTPPSREQKSRSALPTTALGPTEGATRLDFSVQVRMSEMAGWSPERIAAFFAGVAKVLAARNDKVEEGTD